MKYGVHSPRYVNREIYLSAGERAQRRPFGRKGSVTVVLFDESGHLVQGVLDALHDGTLDERQRLAVSEHLCECDECLVRYTESLSEERLLEPPEPLAPGVVAELEHRDRRTRGCVKGLAVAVCFTAGIWLMAMLAAPARREPLQIDPMQTDGILHTEENEAGGACALTL